MNFNAMPTGLSPAGIQAYETIMVHLRDSLGGEPQTGGCKTFYSPEEWAERGEKDIIGKAALVVVYEGSSVAPYFSLDACYEQARPGTAGTTDCYARQDAMATALEAIGLYAEEITRCYAFIYQAQGE